MSTGKTYSTKYLLDSNNNRGAEGQILSTTSTGIDWVDANTVPGTGLWLASGNDIYNSNSGNVGIGTTSPGAKLEIKDGDLWLNGATSSSHPEIRFLDNSPTIAGAKIRYNNTDGNLYVEHMWDTSTSGIFFRNRTTGTTLNTMSLVNGDVGIGTTSPTSVSSGATTLEISGTVTNKSGALRLTSSDDSLSSYFYHQSSGLTMGTASADPIKIITNNSEKIRIESGGNVGIGTTSPSYKLHSTGTIGIAGNTLNNAIRLSINESTTFPGSNSSDTRLLNFVGGNGGSDTEIGGVRWLNRDGNSGNYQYHAAGITSHNANAINSGDLRFFVSNNASADSSTGVTEAMRVSYEGNVGIGTTSPAAGLQVAKGGTTIPTAGSSTASAVFGNSTSDDNYGVAIGANSSGVGYISSQRTDGTATTYNLAIQPNGGNVGIGGSPATVTHNPHLDIVGNRGTLTVGTGYFEDNGTTNFLNGARPLSFGTGGTERMRITSAGNVGIGTTSPARKLSVENSSSSIIADFKYSAAAYSSIDLSNNVSFARLSSLNSDLLLSPAGVEKMRVTSSGNVGIGTSTPNAKLDIQGTQGQLFSVTDDLSGEIFAVADISGVPIMTVNSSGTIQFSDLSAGTLVTDANGNISVSSGGGAGGPYLPLTAGSTKPLTGDLFIATSDPQLILERTGGSNVNPSGRIVFKENNASEHFQINYNGLNDRLEFRGLISTTMTDMVYINRDVTTPLNVLGGAYFTGNVGIGVTNPGNKLRVEGSVRINDSGDGQLFFGTGSLNKIELDGTDMELWSGGLVPTITMSNQGLIKLGSYSLTGGTGTPNNLLGVDSLGNVIKTNSFNLILDDTPASSTASGNIVNWSVSETVTAGTLYAVKTNGGWTTADADSEPKSTYMLAIALGSNATAGMLLQGFFYKASHGFTIGLPLYISNTAGAFSNSRPTGSGDYVRIIGYATSANHIYFDPDKTWVKLQ